MRLDNDEALRFLRSLEHAAQKEVSDYLSNALDRLGATFELIPDDLLPQAEVLEIGALPYYMTALLLRYTDFSISAINEPNPRADSEGEVTLRSSEYDFSKTVSYRSANIEFDPFPYPDNHFDMVFYCEVIEHLTYDPTQTLYEIHRVLKPDGHLIITTPNPFRYTSILRYIRGKNIYPHYSGYNSYARHHREFSAGELRQLLNACNFEVNEIYTIHDRSYDHPRYIDAVVRGALRVGLLRGQQDVVMLRARAHGKPRYGYPADLYVDVHAYDRATESAVIMGDNEEPQLGGGWYPLEEWPPHIRWTSREAGVRLAYAGQRMVSLYVYSGPKELARTVTGTLVMNKVEHRISMPPDEWQVLSFPVPEGVEGRLLLLLYWDETWIPHEVVGLPDTREIGVAVNKIWLHNGDDEAESAGEG